MADALRKFLFVIGCCLSLAWIVISAMLVWSLVPECLAGGAADGPPGMRDCGDARRGAFAVSLVLGILSLPVGSLLMLPLLLRRRPPGEKSGASSKSPRARVEKDEPREKKERARPARGQAVVVGGLTSTHRAILAAVVLFGLVGLALFVTPSSDEAACRAWQQRYRAATPPADSSGALETISLGPLAELRESRPEGCPVPD